MAENEPNSEARDPLSPAAFSMPADYEADKVPDAQKLAALVRSKNHYSLASGDGYSKTGTQVQASIGALAY